MTHSNTPQSSPPSKGLFPAERLPGYPSSSNNSGSRQSLTRRSLRTRRKASDRTKSKSPSIADLSETRSQTPDFTSREQQSELAFQSDDEVAESLESADNDGLDEPRLGYASNDNVSDAKRDHSWSADKRQNGSACSPIRRQLRKRIGEFKPYTKDRNDRRRQGQGRKPLAKEHIGGVNHIKGAMDSSFKREEERNTTTVDTPPSSKTYASHTLTPTEDTGGQSQIAVADKVLRTTLYISLDGSKYPAVPIYLKSCGNIEDLFNEILKAWDLTYEDIEIVTVRFPWLEDRHTFTVKRSIPDTFHKMKDVVLEAPCWTSDDRSRCELEIKVYRKRNRG